MAKFEERFSENRIDFHIKRLVQKLNKLSGTLVSLKFLKNKGELISVGSLSTIPCHLT